MSEKTKNDAHIQIRCDESYKSMFKEMAKDRKMSMSNFFKYLVEKQREEDRKYG
jgi:cytidylate kinase